MFYILLGIVSLAIVLGVVEGLKRFGAREITYEVPKEQKVVTPVKNKRRTVIKLSKK